MKTLQYLMAYVYTIFSHKKVVILRDLNYNCSFLYRDNIEADFLVKENCDSNFEFISKPDITSEGFQGRLLSNGIILMVVDLHSIFKNKILNNKEKTMVVKNILNKKSELMIAH